PGGLVAVAEEGGVPQGRITVQKGGNIFVAQHQGVLAGHAVRTKQEEFARAHKAGPAPGGLRSSAHRATLIAYQFWRRRSGRLVSAWATCYKDSGQGPSLGMRTHVITR